MADEHTAVLFGAAAAGEQAAASAGPSAGSAGAGAALGAESEPSTPTAAKRAKGGARKRVFTFQKRWQHALPIMERALPASVISGTAMKPRINESAPLPAEVAGTAQGEMVDVVVCMVCDEPTSAKRDAPKIWSRINCRRGRIENHLWSKHPEFMSLLKQKQEAEGDLAVQIFLQSMRDGRCNVRNEIVAGLYSNLQATGAKRNADEHAGVQVSVGADADAKRAKVGADSEAVALASGMSPAMYSGGALTRSAANRESEPDGVYVVPPAVAPASPFNDSSPITSSWSSSLANKVVVMTGSDNELMMNVAAHLWSIGANVLVTFSDRSMLDTFMATSLARCPETHEHLGIPRGAMLPLLCDFTTKKQLDDWSRSIAARFPRVHCLINYIPVVSSDKKESGNSVSALGAPLDRLQAITRAVSLHCVPSTNTANAFCSVINVTASISTSSESVHAWAHSASLDAHPKPVSANFVEVPIDLATVGGDVGRNQRPQDVMSSTLVQSITLLCTPAGQLISGSILRLDPEHAKRRASEKGSTASTNAAIVEGITESDENSVHVV